MDDLGPRVHAAVGASGGRHADRGTRNRRKRGLEGVLHRTAAGLGLPAEKAATVVFETLGDSQEKR